MSLTDPKVCLIGEKLQQRAKQTGQDLMTVPKDQLTVKYPQTEVKAMSLLDRRLSMN